MENKEFYKVEKINWGSLFFIILCIIMMTAFTSFKISNPSGWAPFGYLAVMGFMGIALAISILLLYNGYRKKKIFLTKKKNILENGISIPGKVIDTKEVVYKYESNSANLRRTSFSYRYYALVEFNYNGQTITYWTPELSFNGKDLISSDISVHIYNDEYYIDDFQLNESSTYATESTFKSLLDPKEIWQSLYKLAKILIPVPIIAVGIIVMLLEISNIMLILLITTTFYILYIRALIYLKRKVKKYKQN